jgi:hypothetical protein
VDRDVAQSTVAAAGVAEVLTLKQARLTIPFIQNDFGLLFRARSSQR